MSKSSVLAGSLLVAGTSIGGGMLALPVLTSHAGFIPSVFAYFLSWAFMASTGLLFLEVSQWMKGDSNIISMARYTLGRAGKISAWIVYLFLFYCLTIAYVVGCGNIFVEFSQNSIPQFAGPILFVALFAPFLLIPTQVAGRFNVWLILGLALSYFGFVLLGFQYVNVDFLTHRDWSYSLYVLPIAFTSFAYQGIVPTLATMMNHDPNKIRKAILIGSSIPLFAYIVWEGLILGIVPYAEPHGLVDTLHLGQTAVYPLKYFINNPWINWLGQFLAFFALVTSFLGVTLGLRDFLADGLKIEKNRRGLLLLVFLVIFPPLVVAILFPHIFLIALEYAGGFGTAYLLGLLPILMIWRGRYVLHLPSEKQLSGGKFVLLLLGLFVSIELVSEGVRLIQRLL
jgi:tyrosine-specific transport protein